MSTLDHPLAAQPPTVAGPFDWIDALPDPALVIDAGKDRVLAANRALARMLGRSRQALESTHSTELFPGERPELVTFTEETLLRGRGWSREFNLPHRDGHRIEVEITSSRLGPPEARTLLMLLRGLPAAAQPARAARGEPLPPGRTAGMATGQGTVQ